MNSLKSGPAAHDGEADQLASSVARRLRSAGCVFAEAEAQLLIEAAAGDNQRLGHLVERRAAGVPIEPLLGWVSFCGLRIAIAPGVFVPRLKTELLAERARDRLRKLARKNRNTAHPDQITVVELCCGAAAISAVLAIASDDDGFAVASHDADLVSPKAQAGAGPARVELFATDIDPTAVTVARQNVGWKAHLAVGDLYQGLPDDIRHRVDILIANAPYVPSDAIQLMPREAREYEPQIALDGGPDGIAVQKRIIIDAPDWLAPDGWLLIETGREQSKLTAAMMKSVGFRTRVITDDHRDATIVIGHREEG